MYKYLGSSLSLWEKYFSSTKNIFFVVPVLVTWEDPGKNTWELSFLIFASAPCSVPSSVCWPLMGALTYGITGVMECVDDFLVEKNDTCDVGGFICSREDNPRASLIPTLPSPLVCGHKKYCRYKQIVSSRSYRSINYKIINEFIL